MIAIGEKNFFKVFKALGEPTRLKIVKMLSVQGMCVCELSEVLGMLQPRVSQHLKILKDADIVSESKEGYWVYYSLNKEYLDNLWEEFLVFLEADIKSLPGFEKEASQLGTLGCNERINEIKKKLKEQKN